MRRAYASPMTADCQLSPGPRATSGLAQATPHSRVSRRIFVARALLYSAPAGQPSGFNSFPERTEIQSNKVLQGTERVQMHAVVGWL